MWRLRLGQENVDELEGLSYPRSVATDRLRERAYGSYDLGRGYHWTLAMAKTGETHRCGGLRSGTARR